MDTFRLIVGSVIILGGIVYIFQGNWGLVLAGLGLVAESIKQALSK